MHVEPYCNSGSTVTQALGCSIRELVLASNVMDNKNYIALVQLVENNHTGDVGSIHTQCKS
jgi:hypothetical protein